MPAAPAFADESDRLSAVESAVVHTARPDAARRGEKTFVRACAACHGRRGRGDGPASADLNPPPRDLASYQFRFRTTSTGSLPLPVDLERTIHRGLPGSSMPAFDELFSVEETSDLIHFIFSLQESGSFDGEQRSEINLKPVLPIEPTSLRDGQAIYGRTTDPGNGFPIRPV
jgi:mono/diheme cytochrome c family protein